MGNTKKKIKINYKWIINIMIITFVLAIIISIASEIVLRNTNLGISVLILIIIIALGILADILGIAIAAANIEPFNAMASRQVKGAKIAIILLKNAPAVSNFCNDVIGDIAGIISGAAGAILILQVGKSIPNVNLPILSVVISGLIASITVGGKAIGKEYGIRKAKNIILNVSTKIYWIENKLHIRLISRFNKKKK